ncbi:glycoside hydrolase family 76 protein [Pedobacter xixiisoli]|uniref:Predicted alpha-1,6-mannanase, GH76 family n=1 Tax=Pedobacter xixiisoli TaxID=1476464 RepID=A0A286A0A9_9SPHI|nr:glycoside hydrolase family 76 protein [Pedobacter xixiisoli]SOD15343.1 Predicted alpha-1,6-mannanase, GH76 family [Pedobacter xixiisoli]
MKLKLYITVCLLIVFGFYSCGKINDEYIERNPIPKIDWNKVADSSSQALMTAYWNTTKHHFNNNNLGAIGQYDYWPEAHGLEVLIDAYERTKSDLYKNAINDFYQGVRVKNGNSFYNNYYDDMAWHAVAHLRAFQVTGDTRYETSAKYLWDEIVKGWNDFDGGGIRWNHEENTAGRSKGIPTNGPSTITAARRWQKYGEAQTALGLKNNVWYNRIYDWMKNHRVVQQSGRVFETIDNTRGDWTYNTGTYIGSALEIYNITGDRTYLKDAIKTADWTMANLINTNNRVLSDWAEQQDHDVNLFKGIFIRYFTQLIMHKDLPEANRKRYITFIKHSAETLWLKGTLKTPVPLYGYHWWEAPQTANVSLRAQISGCTLMEAMALLQNKGLLN